jgi:hypothetical protein
MTVVETVEALEAIPLGGRVVESTRTWTRVEQGWERDGDVIPSSFFTAKINARAVTVGEWQDPTVGSWWLRGERLLLYLGRVGEQHLFSQYTNRRVGEQQHLFSQYTSLGLFERVWLYTEEALRTWAETAASHPTPRWGQVAFSTGSHLLALQREVAALEQAKPPGFTGTLTAFVEGLHSLLDEFDDDDDRNRVEELLAEYGVPSMEEVTVTVSVSGVTHVEPRDSTLREMLGADSEVDVEAVDEVASVGVSWSFSFDHFVNGRGCQCDEVNSDVIEDHRLFPTQADSDDYTYERTCDRCS